MASDISLAVGDGARRMTYAELATVRGISQASARRLVLRHHWPRQRGNDGIVRATVPLTALVKGAETAGCRVTMTGPATSLPTDTVSPPAVSTTDTVSDPVTVTLTRPSIRCVNSSRSPTAESISCSRSGVVRRRNGAD
jgi:hypothetical protein